MPTALQASRDFMARGIARVRAGIEGVGKGSAQAGPEIKVDPFGAGNVSTPAALVKVATQVLASRRRRANYEMAREGAALAREKTRAEIARIRAAEQRDLGQGRQPTGPQAPAPMTLASPVGNIPAGPGADPRAVAAENARLNREGAAKRAAHRSTSVSNLARAKANLADIAGREKRDTEAHTNAHMQASEAVITRAKFVDSEGKPDAVAKAALQKLGVDPAGFEALNAEGRDRLLKSVREQIRTRARASYEKNVNQYYAPLRAQHEQALDRESLNLAAPSEAAAAPEDDPLGIFQP